MHQQHHIDAVADHHAGRVVIAEFRIDAVADGRVERLGLGQVVDGQVDEDHLSGARVLVDGVAGDDHLSSVF